MNERREDLARLMTAEQGKPLRMARNEVGYAADFLLWFAEEAKRVYGATIPSARADQRFLTMYQPVGVAAAITPWNYPISMLTRKIAPALAAGCTIVVKPAEQTPLCAVETIKVFEEAGLSRPVWSTLVTASDPIPVADEFLSNWAVRKITFTGSTEVGKQIAARAAGQLKRVSLELGGHAPFIVFPDADPVHAARGARSGEVPEHRPGLYLPQPACSCTCLGGRPVRRRTVRPGRQAPARQRARRRRHGRTADRPGRGRQDGAPGRRRHRQGCVGRPGRASPVRGPLRRRDLLRPHGADGRDAGDADLP